MRTNKEILYENLRTMTNEQYDKYLEEERNGYINIKEHPEDNNIVILNYTDATTYARHWTHETMSARGLILDLSSKTNNRIYILADPFGKFFNIGENPDYEEGFEDWEIESVMEKMDGSLGISYFFNDEIRFATRGSFISEQAIKATEIWNNKYQHRHIMHIDKLVPVTYLVEIIYPENRIVVNYGTDEELVMIGVRYIGNKNQGELDGAYESLVVEGMNLEMRVAPSYLHTLQEMLEMKETIPSNEEGWVVKFKNGKRLKIKGKQYLDIHRLVYGLSTKAKYKSWSEGKLDEYIMKLPEEYRDELEEFRDYIEPLKEATLMLYQMYYKNTLNNTSDDKEFAQYVTMNFDKSIQRFIFRAKTMGRVPEEMVKYTMYKNYTEHEEGFNEWKRNKQAS